MLQGTSGGLWTMENKIRVAPDACCFLSDVQMITLAEQQLCPQYTAKVLREHGAEQTQKALPEDGAKQARESLAKAPNRTSSDHLSLQCLHWLE